MTRRAWLAFGLMLFALPLALGCTPPPPLYDWGIYEQILWEGYKADHGDFDPTEQLARLDEDVQRIVGSGARVPPGVHAHLGFLRYSTGDLVAAREHFLEERELFPESAVFIDGLLARMEGSGPLPAEENPEPESSGEEGSHPQTPEFDDAGAVTEDAEVVPDLPAGTNLDAGESDP